MKPMLAFYITMLIGAAYSIYGLFTSLTDLGVGAAIAGVGFIGYSFYAEGWDQ